MYQLLVQCSFREEIMVLRKCCIGSSCFCVHPPTGFGVLSIYEKECRVLLGLEDDELSLLCVFLYGNFSIDSVLRFFPPIEKQEVPYSLGRRTASDEPLLKAWTSFWFVRPFLYVNDSYGCQLAVKCLS